MMKNLIMIETKVVKEVYESGVTNFITAGYSVESSKKCYRNIRKI